MYGSSSEYGPAVAAWQGIKEVSDGWNFFVARDFSRDFYQAIKSTGTTQPVGIDNSPFVKLPVTDPVNQSWFNDAADYYNLHIYRDDGAIPDTSKLDKPFILGEFGADWKCPNGGLPPESCQGSTTHLADSSSDWNLNAVSKFYPNGKIAGAKTALGWAWVSNPTIAQHKLDGTNVLGNAGQWIKGWVAPGASATPAPTQTSTSVPAPTPLPTPIPSPADTMPPTASITSPLNNAKIQHGSTVLISASATDNIGVTKVEFYVSNSLKCISTSAPYRCSWKVTGKRGTQYTLKATAYDRSANQSSSTITVLAQ